MLDWKRLFNPWGEIRRLEKDNERLAAIAAEEVRASYHRGYWDASTKTWERTRHLEALNNHLLERLVNLEAMRPPEPYIIAEPIKGRK